MREEAIKKYYVRFGVLNFVFSLIILLVARDIVLLERFFAMIAINLGYHMPYWFYVKLYDSYIKLEGSFEKNFWYFGIKFFIVFGFVSSLIIAFMFVYNFFIVKNYATLTAICVPIGLFLGVLLVQMKLEK